MEVTAQGDARTAEVGVGKIRKVKTIISRESLVRFGPKLGKR